MTKNDIPVGTRFGQLIVLRRVTRRSGNNQYFAAHCDCGREIEVQGSHLLYSRITSCGCARSGRPDTMRRSTRRLRLAWRHMINRCTEPGDKDYVSYGERGIAICPEWLSSFEAFKAWALSNGYRNDLSLDRIDNDGDYTPTNCRWATITEQNRNTRRVRRITAFGETKTLSEWAEDPRCQVSYSTLHQRITTLGWGIEAALLNTKHKRPRSCAA